MKHWQATNVGCHLLLICVETDGWERLKRHLLQESGLNQQLGFSVGMIGMIRQSSSSSIIFEKLFGWRSLNMDPIWTRSKMDFTKLSMAMRCTLQTVPRFGAAGRNSAAKVSGWSLPKNRGMNKSVKSSLNQWNFIKMNQIGNSSSFGTHQGSRVLGSIWVLSALHALHALHKSQTRPRLKSNKYCCWES